MCLKHRLADIADVLLTIAHFAFSLISCDCYYVILIGGVKGLAIYIKYGVDILSSRRPTDCKKSNNIIL